MTRGVVVLVAALVSATGRSALGQDVSFSLPAPSRSSQPGSQVLTLADLEQRALARNPTLAQAASEVQAARGRARQAGMLPNPTVGYTGEEISRGPVIRGGEHGFFVEQTIPLGGKLGLSREIFAREATEAEALVEMQRLRVLTDVRMFYYAALAAERRVEVRGRLAALAAEAVGISRQLFNTGAADLPDVMESEIEARRMQLSFEAAQNDRYRVWRRLASMVGDPALIPQPLDGTIDAPIPELDREAIIQEVLKGSPELKAARLVVERAQAALKRARREPVPDLVLRGGPRYNRELFELNGQPVGWEAAVDVGFVIPLFNRNQGAIAEARAEVGRAEQEVGRLELELRSCAADAFDRYLTTLRSVEAYRTDVLPRAERSYQLYLARYREMGAAYPQVLIAQRTWFQATDQYIDSAEDAWAAVLELQGMLLTGGLDPAASPGTRRETRTDMMPRMETGRRPLRP
jgi:cobalt-zinc-cadmium efflux system outer membrane protein